MGPGWVHHVGRWVARVGVGQGWLSIGWKGGGLATCMLKTKICCAWLLVHERSEHVVSFQQQLAVTSSHVAEGSCALYSAAAPLQQQRPVVSAAA